MNVTFKDDCERKAYEHCRDNMFPLMARMKQIAQQRLAAKKQNQERQVKK